MTDPLAGQREAINLPAEFVARIREDKRPALVCELEGGKTCAYEPGQVFEIERHYLWVTITGTTARAGKWLVRYSVRDFRPHLLRRTGAPQRRYERNGRRFRWSEDQPWEGDEEHGYTEIPGECIDHEAGDALTQEEHDRIYREASASAAWQREQRRIRAEVLRYESRLNEARLKGKPGRARRAIERHLGSMSRRLNEAERKSDRMAS